VRISVPYVMPLSGGVISVLEWLTVTCPLRQSTLCLLIYHTAQDIGFQNCIMPTVIIGAGIIGVSTAYYLSRSSKADDIHLVEASPQFFASASGNAAGFLARDWVTSNLAQLGELSFDLHRQLAEEHNGYERWGYSPSSGSSLEEQVDAGGDWLSEGASRSLAAARTAQGNKNGPSWLKHRDALDVMSDGSSTAQVDPLRLCQFLLDECIGRGVRLHQPSRPLSLTRSASDALSCVNIVGTFTQETLTIPCTELILCAGAWTAEVYRTLFPKSKIQNVPITSLAGHSLVLQSPHWPPPKLHDTEDNHPLVRQDCHAVFTTDAEAGYSPEIFSRMPDGHIYLAGLNSSTYPLPKIASERVIDPKSIAVLRRTAHKLLGDDFEVIREGVCWRPVAKRGVPIICDLAKKGERNVYVAAGHGAWGISKQRWFFFPNLVVIKSYICVNRICGSSKILVRYIIHETDSYPL